ncbi:hypothetical protein [Streptomyces sp. NPDC044948]|uniref:hypothetical protein n=1 Tax=Streptomyces sp. NPDC044948 TaxID=3157092 RepID=UPI0033D362AE
MTQQTAKGITYPESIDHVRMWEHLQRLADDVDPLLDLPDWQAYTATLTGLTLGNGSVLTRYQKLGNRIAVAWSLNWGSTTSGSMPQISLPVAPASLGGMRWTGQGTINDGSGSAWHTGWAVLQDSGTAISTYAVSTSSAITSTLSVAGITMQSGGWLQGHLEYEVAS